MRNYGSVQQFDVKADGSTTIALTPAATQVSGEFTVQAPKGGISGAWPIALGAMLKLAVGIDQPSSGGSAIYADDLPQIMAGYNVQSPWLGTLHERNTMTGPIAKHLVEFVGAGYTYTDGAMVVIPSTDGDTSVVLYQWLPFAQEAFERPHHFGWWLGWLTSTTITAYLAPATTIAAVSTGATIEAPCTLYCWIDYVVSSELIMPTVAQWHLYQQAASGGNTMLIQGIGTKHGLEDVEDGCRLAGLYELFSVKAMGGATTSDNVTSIQCAQIGMDITQNVDSFYAAYRRCIGGHRGPIALSATDPVTDRAGDPYTMQAGPQAALPGAYAMYLPVRSPGRDQQISKVLRFGGDMEIVQTFTTPPTSGKHSWVTLELRELGKQKKKELVGRTGKKGSYTLETIYSTGMPDVRDQKRHPNKEFCLPERVVWA